MMSEPRRHQRGAMRGRTRMPMPRGLSLPAVVAGAAAAHRATQRRHNCRPAMLWLTKVVRRTRCRRLPAKTRPRGRPRRAQPVSPAARVVGDGGRRTQPRRPARIPALKCQAGPKRQPRRHSTPDPRPWGDREQAVLGLGDNASREPEKESHEAVVRVRRANGPLGRLPPVRGSGIEPRRLEGRATGDREAGRGEEAQGQEAPGHR